MAVKLLLSVYGDDNEDGEQQKHQNIQIEMLLSLLEKLILMKQLTLMKFKKPTPMLDS